YLGCRNVRDRRFREDHKRARCAETYGRRPLARTGYACACARHCRRGRVGDRWICAGWVAAAAAAVTAIATAPGDHCDQRQPDKAHPWFENFLESVHWYSSYSLLFLHVLLPC